MRYTLILLIFMLSACGSAKAGSSAYSEQINPPVGFGASLYCFVIKDENGKAIGGNCIPR